MPASARGCRRQLGIAGVSQGMPTSAGDGQRQRGCPPIKPQPRMWRQRKRNLMNAAAAPRLTRIRLSQSAGSRPQLPADAATRLSTNRPKPRGAFQRHIRGVATDSAAKRRQRVAPGVSQGIANVSRGLPASTRGCPPIKLPSHERGGRKTILPG